MGRIVLLHPDVVARLLLGDHGHRFRTATRRRDMAEAAKVLYTAKTHTTGGRQNGVARSSDGQLDIRLSPPGSGRPGTNPEQLFAAGWSACFQGALGAAARKQQIALPADMAVDAEVSLNAADGNYFISARLDVTLPGIPRDIAQTLVEDAHQICPYSKAVRGNIEVEVKLV